MSNCISVEKSDTNWKAWTPIWGRIIIGGRKRKKSF
jgi:hypothetical protein